jgi:hypothetical protein
VLKNILIALGVLFGAFIALAIGVGISSARFRTEQIPFVTAYVTDLYRHWELADVYDRSSNSFLQQATSRQGQDLLQRASTNADLICTPAVLRASWIRARVPAG